LQAAKKPYYNPRTLKEASDDVKEILVLTAVRKQAAKKSQAHGYLRISDVSRLVGISPTVLRLWENLGLISPKRTTSKYRLYTQADIRILKRAQFLRRARKMNAPAIVHMMKTQGLLTSTSTAPKSSSVGARLRRMRMKYGYSLAQVAREAGVSVGFLSAVEREQMSASVSTLRKLARFYQLNILSLFNPSDANPGRVQPKDRKILNAGPGVRMELLAWGNTMMEPHLFRIAPSAGSGESYAHEGEEFLYIIRGTLEIAIDNGETMRLEEGDSFYFESSNAHHWRNPGKRETLVLWVNTPPTF
jgi:DNA-binding transcriptional MerR regulator/mannose-6-phosphate isomerase-like protein (cupin superfamily)